VRWFKLITIILVFGVLWSLFILTGATQGWFRSAIATEGDARAFKEALIGRLNAEFYGNLGLVLIEEGEQFDETYASIGEPVNSDTLFQMASLSKWFVASGVMKLVQDGKIDLDAPVSEYLTRWQLPETTFDNDGVTTRRLLSHTSGLTDGLGFSGYQAGKELPTLESALDNPNGFRPNIEIKVGVEPGSEWRYSGGGYLILQLLIEEVSNRTFEEYMQAEFFGPLGMTRSTFVYPERSTNIAPSYNTSGEIVSLNRFTASGAAGLYTTTSDLTRFIQAQVGKIKNPLTEETIRSMRVPQASVYGRNIWGLGVMLMAQTHDGDYIFGHGGNNAPAINTLALINPETGDGIIVFESGNQALAEQIGFLWNFWQTGSPDFISLESEIERLLPVYFIGWLMIALLVGTLFYREYRKK